MPVTDSPPDAAIPSAPADELGAHVSAAGGVDRAPRRARDIDAVVLQLFTKQPNRWAEPRLDDDMVERFRTERARQRMEVCGSHDSYLINLASPDPALWRRSLASFQAELHRCARLDLDFLVTHPGNATDGDHASGLARNAEGVERVLEAVPGGTRVLLELTAGSGTSVGGRFEDLATILAGVRQPLRARVGVCVDTCHAYAAGYDLVDDWEGVWMAFQDHLPLESVGLFHLNDSVHPRGSHKDRHAGIGQGTLGEAPFRRLMTDPRFATVPKVLETPKGDDPVAADLGNLRLLRSFRTG
jgi:deoxyribonuclease-4